MCVLIGANVNADREAFMAKMHECPDDVMPHRAYADWLYENGFDAEAEYHAKWTIKTRAEEWLRQFAGDVDCDYDTMLEVAKTHCGENSHGDYLIDGGKWEGEWTPDEFWVQYTILTENVPEQKYGDLPGIFSCSC